MMILKGVLTFDNNAYSRLTQDARKEYMKTALKGVKQSTLQGYDEESDV